GALAIHRLRSAAVSVNSTPWVPLITTLSKELSITKPIQLMFTEAQVSPMTWGVIRHTILLPSSALHWSSDRARLVLAHELAHVKRNDGILQLLTQMVCSLYWFNPLVWYAAHRMRIERERACDDHVLGLGTVAEDYADHLVQIARDLRGGHSLTLASVSMAQ